MTFMKKCSLILVVLSLTLAGCAVQPRPTTIHYVGKTVAYVKSHTPPSEGIVIYDDSVAVHQKPSYTAGDPGDNWRVIAGCKNGSQVTLAVVRSSAYRVGLTAKLSECKIRRHN